MNVYRCPECNKEFQSGVEGMVRCPSCGAEVNVHRPPMEGTPWDRKEGGWLAAYVQTIKLTFGQPTYFFEGVWRDVSLVKPLIFALVNAFIVAILVAAYQVGFHALVSGAEIAASFKAITSPLAVLSAPLALLVIFAGVLFFVPLVTCIGLFISAGIYHLCLMILGAANRPFIQTFRVTCYSTGPQLLQILPIAGGMIAGIWQLILTIMGLKIVHRTTWGKTVLAVFLPMILCCGIIILFVSMIIGGVIGAIISASPAS